MSSTEPTTAPTGAPRVGTRQERRGRGASPGRLWASVLTLTTLLTASSAVLAPDPASAAACSERNGWIPQGTVAPAIPGITTLDLVRFADMDGDGDDERLLLDEIGGIREWRNNRGGNWSYRGRIAAGTGYAPDRVKFADMNGDGRDDYLVVKDGGAIDAWINEGGDLSGPSGITPGWRPAGQIARGTGASAGQVYFGDIDGDGDDDYITAAAPHETMYAWRNEGGDRPGYDGWVSWGGISAGSSTLVGSRIGFGDVNCDGRDDELILSPSSRLVVAGNRGFHGGFMGWGDIGGHARGTHDPIDRITLAELDGDGRIDYLVMAPGGTIVGYLNDGGDSL